MAKLLAVPNYAIHTEGNDDMADGYEIIIVTAKSGTFRDVDIAHPEGKVWVQPGLYVKVAKTNRVKDALSRHLVQVSQGDYDRIMAEAAKASEPEEPEEAPEEEPQAAPTPAEPLEDPRQAAPKTGRNNAGARGANRAGA